MDLKAPARQTASLETTEHRPWPRPKRMWTMGQTWNDLLFAHWPVERSLLQRHVPSSLAVEEFDGSAWLGITPFAVTGLRLVATPPLPVVSDFPELNVRTYVVKDGRPGIWFFSLDAASRLAVAGARRFYRLPYFRARMEVTTENGAVDYSSRRVDRRGHDARFRAAYGPVGEGFIAGPGMLEHFLTERYCLYSSSPKGELLRAEIHHPPWPLQPAEAEIGVNTMPHPQLGPATSAPLLHYAKRQDVLVWSPEPA